jgi:holliday junction DNA helicase RuvA
LIAHVRGVLVHASGDQAVVDVGGVGYRCLVPASTRVRLPGPGSEVRLYTSLQVREDSMTLYGFLDHDEYELFELLLLVEGIGPRVALGVLSAVTPDSFRKAVVFADTAALTRIPGIGKKTAQRILVELKERLGAGKGAVEPAAGPLRAAGPDSFAEAMEALVSLGFGRLEAGEALERVRPDAGEAPVAEQLVKLALKQLYKG